MNQSSDSELALLWVNLIQLGRYPIIAITWITFYEWILTMGMEVELIHQKKWTSVKIAYLLCRYYPMIYFPVLSWAYVGNHDPRLCPHVVVPLQILQAPLQIIPHAVMMMRAYAFTGRNRKILIGLSLLYIALIAVNLRVFITENTLPSEGFYDILGPMGCFPNYGIPSMAARMGYVMIAAVVTDGVSLAVILVANHIFPLTKVSSDCLCSTVIERAV